MKSIYETFDEKDFKKLERAKEHYGKTWKEFLYYCCQLYWKDEILKRHKDLKGGKNEK